MKTDTSSSVSLRFSGSLCHWLNDRTAKFIYNNYVQALQIIKDFEVQLEIVKETHGFTGPDFERWREEELKYLKGLVQEPAEDALPVAYVDALRNLARAE